MSFEDPSFALLLLVTYGLWLLVRRREAAAVWLLTASSLVFYGAKQPRLLLVLLAYCVVGWGVGRWLGGTARPRLVLALGVGFNLAVLCFYKYTPLVVTTLAGASLWPGDPPAFERWSIPFGISFFSFVGIAYMVDVYRKATPPEPSLLRFTLFKAFFPQLVAGPILRADEFLTSLRPGALPREGQGAGEAAWLLARGYFKKMVLANRIALAIDPFFAHVSGPATAGVWSLPYVYLYALQIYLDFSAYTDIARGLGMLFGYRWPDNFNWPYLAASVADFWKRWHVTLSRFLRDYLYIPLGGNRRGAVRTSANLMATMLLGGLWHGASWSFLVWGGLHGLFLVLHRAWSALPVSRRLAERGGPGWRAFCVFLTFHCVCLAWCFFRLTALGDSLACARKWVDFDPALALGPAVLDPALGALLGTYAVVAVLVATAERWRPSREGLASLLAGCRWGLRAAVLLLAVVLSPGGQAPAFIYFQF